MAKILQFPPRRAAQESPAHPEWGPEDVARAEAELRERREKIQSLKLVIKIAPLVSPCEVCGLYLTKPSPEPVAAIFVDGTESPVCYDCEGSQGGALGEILAAAESVTIYRDNPRVLADAILETIGVLLDRSGLDTRPPRGVWAPLGIADVVRDATARGLAARYEAVGKPSDEG
jgi:hypothetical protein